MNLNETISKIRQYPGWRARISPALAAIVVGLVVVGLGGAMLAIQRQKPAVPRVDHRLEQRLARERQLREEGNALLQQGKIHEAYAKFEQLYKMAPNSPAVADTVQKLEAIRQKEELNKQQLTDSKTKRDQGIQLFNQKNYPDAIKLLQDSFNLNPADDITVNYLKLAQTQQAIIDATNLARQAAAHPAGTPGGSPIANAANPSRVVPGATAPAQLTTIFDSPFSDGYILVRVGMDTVAHENLFEEKGRFFKRVVPKVINTTSSFPAKNADVDVWVVVPSQNINNHAKIRHNFLPGTAQKLLVSFNPQSKQFAYQLN